MIKSIENLLELFQQELLSLTAINSSQEGALKDRQSLLRHISTLELRENLFLLKEKLDVSNRFALRNIFIKLASERYEQVKGTALQNAAYPDSPTNMLYNALYDIIFYERNINDFCDRLSVLCPSTKYLLKIDCTGKFITHENTKRIAPAIEAKLIPLNEAKGLNFSFSEVIMDEEAGIMLPLASVINKNYGYLHCIYLYLKEHHPNLYNKLKSHNEGIQHLYNQIEALNNQGITPRKALEELRNHLTLSGTKVTGLPQAGPRAGKAVTRFNEYIESLPPASATSLLNLQIYGDRKLKDLRFSLTYTSAEVCVEQSSSDINSLLKRFENKNILDRPPQITQIQRNQWIKEINSTSLSTEGEEVCDTFPPHLLSAVIKTIKVHTASEFGEFLANFNESFYKLILSNTNSIPIQNFYQLQDCLVFLTPEQKLAFITAMRMELPKLIKNGSHYGNLLSDFDVALYPDLMQHIQMQLSVLTFADLTLLIDHLHLQQQRRAFFENAKNQLSHYITTSSEFGKFLSKFESQHHAPIINELFTHCIKTTKDLINATTYLIAMDRLHFFEAIKDHLDGILTTAEDLALFLRCIDPDQHPNILSALKTVPIYNCQDLSQCLKLLPDRGKSRPELLKFLRAKLPLIITSFYELIQIYSLVSVYSARQFLTTIVGTDWAKANIGVAEIPLLAKWCNIQSYEYFNFLSSTFGLEWLKDKTCSADKLKLIVTPGDSHDLKQFLFTTFNIEWMQSFKFSEIQPLVTCIHQTDRKSFLTLVFGSSKNLAPRFTYQIKEMLELCAQTDRLDVLETCYGSKSQNEKLLLSPQYVKEIIELLPFYDRKRACNCFNFSHYTWSELKKIIGNINYSIDTFLIDVFTNNGNAPNNVSDVKEMLNLCNASIRINLLSKLYGGESPKLKGTLNEIKSLMPLLPFSRKNILDSCIEVTSFNQMAADQIEKELDDLCSIKTSSSQAAQKEETMPSVGDIPKSTNSQPTKSVSKPIQFFQPSQTLKLTPLSQSSQLSKAAPLASLSKSSQAAKPSSQSTTQRLRLPSSTSRSKVTLPKTEKTYSSLLSRSRHRPDIKDLIKPSYSLEKKR